MPDKLASVLISHCDSVFVGPNGDYASVLEVVDHVSAQQASWKPAATQNSIWQITEHLIDAKKWQINMLKHGRAVSQPWVEGVVDETAWQDTRRRLKNAHRQLIQTLEKFSDADLLSIPDQKAGHTLLELILSSGPAHEAHHNGQMDYLKGLYPSNAGLSSR